MFSTNDKAIVAIIMGVAFLLQTWLHIQIPGFLTPDNITQALAILTPLVVYLFPNKTTQEQTKAVLATVGVTPSMAAAGVGTGGSPIPPSALQQ